MVVTSFVIGLGALVGAVNTIVTDTKPWVCVGFSFSWCERPKVPDTWSFDVGGPGGNPFDPITCRPGHALVGLYGKVVSKNIGPFIASVGPICAEARFDRRNRLISLSTETVSKGDEAGSGQGDSFELKCPPNTVAIGSELDSTDLNMTAWNKDAGVHHYLVTPLALKCSDVLSPADISRIKIVSGAADHLVLASRTPFICPEGSSAFGIKGRSGHFVDAISLGCRSSQ
ncbi:MAG TPA: hypothetical protein VGO49_01330 [Bradyrhizobium sp.]|nr:hypothetical protein [Bradyrhizobium sp.]